MARIQFVLQSCVGFLCLLLLVAQLHEVVAKSASDVIVLNDDNFEHLTQATSGSTTGHWLVEFYAPWCGHCKSLEPIWAELASELKGTIPVAKVDATQNPLLKKRFNINSFPTILFFKLGKVYEFEGQRTAETLKAFALTEYKQTTAKPIPTPVSQLDLIVNMLVDDFTYLANTKKLVVFAIFSVGILAGLLAGILLACVRGSTASAPSTTKTKRTTTTKAD